MKEIKEKKNIAIIITKENYVQKRILQVKSCDNISNNNSIIVRERE